MATSMLSLMLTAVRNAGRSVAGFVRWFMTGRTP
jgi:hypothetical protein